MFCLMYYSFCAQLLFKSKFKGFTLTFFSLKNNYLKQMAWFASLIILNTKNFLIVLLQPVDVISWEQ